MTTIGRFAFAANEGNTGTAKCNINFNELTQLSSVGAGAFYNAKMNLVDSTTPVAPSSRAATPVSLDLSKTKITNFEANAFAFNSDTPISILTLPTSVAIADNGIANNAFSFQSGSTIKIKGGKDVTAAQMQQLQSIIKESGATSAPISSSSVNWAQDSSGNSQFDQWQQQATSGVVISQLKFVETSLTANDLSKYSEIANLQLKTQFTSFGDANTFANTSIGSITFGSKAEGSIAADEVNVTTEESSQTKKSTTLSNIINLFAADNNSLINLSTDTNVLEGWTEETTQSTRADGDTSTTTKPRKSKTINGLKWSYNPNDNTISCANVNGYIYQQEQADANTNRATNPTFQSFKDSAAIIVTICVASNFGDSLVNNSTPPAPSTPISRILK